MRSMLTGIAVALLSLTMLACGGSEEKPSPPAGDSAAAATPQPTGADSAMTTSGDSAMTAPAASGEETEEGEKNEDGEEKKSEGAASTTGAATQTPTTAQNTTPRSKPTPATPPAAPDKTPPPPPAPAQTTTPTPTPPSPPAQATPPTAGGGKAIFTAQKCNGCHAISGQGIARTAPVSEGQEPPSDLSSAGKSHDADWFVRWLQKKETLNGKKHIKGFKGSDEDLQTLAKWLAGLR